MPNAFNVDTKERKVLQKAPSGRGRAARCFFPLSTSVHVIVVSVFSSALCHVCAVFERFKRFKQAGTPCQLTNPMPEHPLMPHHDSKLSYFHTMDNPVAACRIVAGPVNILLSKRPSPHQASQGAALAHRPRGRSRMRQSGSCKSFRLSTQYKDMLLPST